MPGTLILYSTTDGHTLKICRRLQTLLKQEIHRVNLLPIADASPADLEAAERILIGASIRYGRHNPAVSEFVTANRDALDRKPNAFFSVNLVARKPGRNQPASNPYLQRFLRQVDWKPRLLGVFAGKLDYPKYGPLDRTIIRLIMWMTHGPTDPHTTKEFTDWDQVDAFARAFLSL